MAWHPLGWTPAFFAEIEKFPSAVLAHHYPSVPNLGDMTKFKEWPDAAIDVLVGGTPCQSFSVAGLRKGLADPRGNLALTYLAIADRYRPEWLVWENVPGVLSSGEGRDFGAFLGGLAELGYGFAYRVLDAQYVRVDGFGRAVPQRRRRVFVVGHSGDWRRAAAVLFEHESLSGYPAPSREARQGTAAGTDGGVVGSLCADSHPGAYSGQDAYTGRLIAHATHDVVGTLCAEDSPHGGRGLTGLQTMLSGYIQPVSYAIQAGATRENPDSGPDGVGVQSGHAYTIEARPEVQAVAFAKMRVSGTLGQRTTDHPNGMKSESDFIVPVAFTCSEQANSFAWERDVYPTLDAQIPNDSSNIQKGIRQGWAVRRLTPTECERLQGFPDGYTDIKNQTPDGPRYKALGNSMAVNVMRWIGRRIELVRELSEEMRAAA